MEVLSPAGNMEKLKTAVYFGADAVYFGGKKFGLRAYAGNFTNEEIVEAVNFCHQHNVKAYVTVNIVAHNRDFDDLKEYLQFLSSAHVDGVIVSDLGIAKFVTEYAKGVELHISTQANITNKYAAKFMVEMGAKRLVLARELTLTEIKEIRDFIPKEIELEAFVHGAMCISYSGRCLLSNYLSSRKSNYGECIQACRWKWTISEASRQKEQLPITEDERGTYILNSKDLNMIEYIDQLKKAGVTSLKIEGRMKSPYYVATVTNAYKRACKSLEEAENNNKEYFCPKELVQELEKTSHRRYTTGFNLKDKRPEQSEYIEDSMPVQTHEFMAVVVEESKNGKVKIEQRNKFVVGDILEVLSPNQTFNKQIVVKEMFDELGLKVEEAKLVQQQLILTTDLKLKKGDILRKLI
ncbi:MAG: U32 family peptidase [Clostridia bacterium]|nr:U32 family peptidase [Clostridia bacterium]